MRSSGTISKLLRSTWSFNNDDYINVDFQCGGESCNGKLTEANGSNRTVQVVVLRDYESQGLSDGNRS